MVVGITQANRLTRGPERNQGGRHPQRGHRAFGFLAYEVVDRNLWRDGSSE